jgi:hypothetical protein
MPFGRLYSIQVDDQPDGKPEKLGRNEGLALFFFLEDDHA